MKLSSHIDHISKKLFERLSSLNLKEIGISEYNQRYLKEYIDNYPFYVGLYKQLLIHAINELDTPVEQSTFVDYGGGCGLLSFLAKETGFNKVIYNDIYEVSVSDATLISGALNIKIDHFVPGNVDELVDTLSKKDIFPNLICSFDVLEHIYNLKEWFGTISKLNKNFCLVFMTSANPYNPVVRNRLMKMQLKDEYKGSDDAWGMKERDIKIPFLLARKKIIKELLPNANEEILNSLAKQTRGLQREDIAKAIEEYKIKGSIQYKIDHPTNTCDPFTGNWTENLIHIPSLINMLTTLGFETQIDSALYSYSKNRPLNVAKKFLNLLIRRGGRKGLYLSATYILKARI